MHSTTTTSMTTTTQRKRPRSEHWSSLPKNNNNHMVSGSPNQRRFLCLCLALTTVLLSPVEGFGIAANHHASRTAAATTTTSSSRTTSRHLSSSTLAPPPHHMEWLRFQDDLEKRKAKNQQQQSNNKKQVLPLTLFKAPEKTALSNSTATNTGSDTALSAKEAWAASFTTVEALRDTFGRNQNVVWGDLDASTTRRLYKTLLPRALLELYHCHGASSEDLAPLAYRARVAAKKYARERSELPARLGANLLDGWRQFCTYGKFEASGMSYPQLWEKYATQILQEENFENEQDLTSRVCYRILQKSCETNKRVDSLFLSDEQDLQDITLKLEQEVYDLLEHEPEDKNLWAIRRYKILKTLLRIRRKMEGHSFTETDDKAAMRAVLEDAAKEA
mmetsp:Transcript_12148/g.29503  ORF Transcript_12148/g.29503 Transcript_12148/m.29503 type:complete len:390 (+) Transcript_12148:307-1476(+)